MAHISRRLKNESKEWKFRTNESYQIIVNDNNVEIEVCVFKIGYIYNTFFKFNILFDYPFKPPQIYLNGKNVKKYLVSTKLFQNEFKNQLGTDCFCCKSITCINNWSPTYNIVNIIDEIVKYFKLKLKIIQCFILKKNIIFPDEINNLIISYM